MALSSGDRMSQDWRDALLVGLAIATCSIGYILVHAIEQLQESIDSLREEVSQRNEEDRSDDYM